MTKPTPELPAADVALALTDGAVKFIRTHLDRTFVTIVPPAAPVAQLAEAAE